MAKDPAFLFYPNDWLGGTLGMTLVEKGAYIEVLMLQFNRGHMTEHMIGQVIGQLWDNIKDKFVLDEDGRYYNVRLEQEQEKRKSYTESRRNNTSGNNQHTLKSSKKEEKKQGHMTEHMEDENVNEIIDSIYSLYPNKCLVQKERSLGKSKSDKIKIKTLLKTKTKEELKSVIEKYKIECVSGKVYMKNFATFLNNIPDYNSEDTEAKKDEILKFKSCGFSMTGNRNRFEQELQMYGAEKVFLI